MSNNLRFLHPVWYSISTYYHYIPQIQFYISDQIRVTNHVMRCSWIYNQWFPDVWCMKWVTKYFTRILLNEFDKCIKVWLPHHLILISYQGTMSFYQGLPHWIVSKDQPTRIFHQRGKLLVPWTCLVWDEGKRSLISLSCDLLLAVIIHPHLPIFLLARSFVGSHKLSLSTKEFRF